MRGRPGSLERFGEPGFGGLAGFGFAWLATSGREGGGGPSRAASSSVECGVEGAGDDT